MPSLDRSHLEAYRTRMRRSHRKKNKLRRNERDACVSFLIVTSSTLHYWWPREREREKEIEREEREIEREKEWGQDYHYYSIISCITVTVNEVSYYTAYRGGEWKKRRERRPTREGEERRANFRAHERCRWKNPYNRVAVIGLNLHLAARKLPIHLLGRNRLLFIYCTVYYTWLHFPSFHRFILHLRENVKFLRGSSKNFVKT